MVLYFSSLSTSRYHSDDQANLEEMLRRLPPNNMWKLTKANEDGDPFLLVHQTLDQQALLARFGNEICLLDATYRTTKYAMPMFFVVVRTNTVYQVTATFVVSEETKDAISAAIQQLKLWNPEWHPSNWMTDCCVAEIRALEHVFPG